MHMDQRFNARRLAWLLLLVALTTLAGVVRAAPARQDPYPVPEQPTADPLVPLASPSAYPAPLPGSAATPELIGSPPEGQPAVLVIVATPEATPVSRGQGVLYLWLGFIATLLIFVASVIGAMMIFTRRVQS